jgi:O-antigen/teichoic acid export membrane protein
MFYMPILQHYVGEGYREGLGVIPIVMMAEIFMGIYFNLSFWYKLTDQNWWGAIISAIGVAVMIVVNVIFVPRIGYWACAWGGFAGYGISMLLSYFIGQKKYPIKYPLGRIALFFVIAAAMFAVYEFLLKDMSMWPAMGIGTALLLLYCFFVYREIRGEKSIAA